MVVQAVLGLGNPGVRYAPTRHNIGFKVVDELKRRHARGHWVRRANCEMVVAEMCGPGEIFGLIVLARPLTFMNRSGEAADRLLSHFDFSSDRLLVVVDDVDLGLGRLRLRPSGGPGTHNGMRSLCQSVGRGFPRLRVGVRGGEVRGSLADYVLAQFALDEVDRVTETVSRAADAVEAAIREGLDRAMNEYNRNPDALRPD